MHNIVNAIYWALTVYIICCVVWALLGWLDQLSPATARHPSVITVRRFLDSIVLPYIRLFSFVPQPAGFPLDVQSLAAFISLFVAQRIVQANL